MPQVHEYVGPIEGPEEEVAERRECKPRFIGPVPQPSIPDTPYWAGGRLAKRRNQR